MKTAVWRSRGEALIWVLIFLVVVIGGYFVWKKMAPPNPAPVVIAATPVPATPAPATPEPTVAQATPTPTPIPTPTPAPVVVATPPPTPTPPSLDVATVVRTPALWPKQIALVAPAAFPIVISGQTAGEVKAPTGTVLRVLRVGAQQVEVEYQNGRHLVPMASTDLMSRALATFRAMGSVLPTAVAAVAPVAATTATPAPTPTKLKLTISANRKRQDVDRNQAITVSREKTVEKYVYAIGVQSTEFADVPPLEVQYLIFVERQKLGESKESDTIERVTGSGKTEALTRKAALQTVNTSEVELTKSEVKAGFIPAGGGRRRVEDDILGIWVRVLKDGQVVGEYANPSTVTKRGWDPK